MIKQEMMSNRQIYREIFLKIQNEFFQLFDEFKLEITCNNCLKCNDLIYFDKTIKEFEVFIDDNDVDKFYWKDLLSKISPRQNLDYLRSQYPEFYNVVTSFEKKVVFYQIKEDLGKFYEKVCNNYPHRLLTALPSECAYRAWQDKVEHFIRNDLTLQIHEHLKKIDLLHKNYSCKCTGTCCRLSSSEFSYKELLEKAENNDHFAKQFVSIFIPYTNIDEARKIFPEYVDLVLSELGEDENVHFYHCPHIDNNNLCTIYNSDQRPQICADFPNNPLTILYSNCGYVEWKEQVLILALTCHAMIEIATYTFDKLQTLTKHQKESLAKI